MAFMYPHHVPTHPFYEDLLEERELLELEKDPPEKQAKKPKVLVSSFIYRLSFYFLLTFVG